MKHRQNAQQCVISPMWITCRTAIGLPDKIAVRSITPLGSAVVPDV